jgi:prokaryotic YEATS domain
MTGQNASSEHGSNRFTISADEFKELETVKLLHSLEGRLEAWAKKRFWIALVAITAVGLIGIQAIGYLLVDTSLGSRIEDAAIKAALMKDHADRIQLEGDEVVKKAEDAAARTIAKLKQLEEQASRLDARFDRILGEGILTPGGEEEGSVGRYFPSLTQLHREIESLRAEIADVGTKLDRVDVAGATLSGSKEQLDGLIEVKQSAKPIKSANYDDKRQWYQITYEVQPHKNAFLPGGRNVMDLIDKVVYKFDETWFSKNPYRTSVNRSDNFRISFESWGPTKVVAEIYLYGLEEPLVREGTVRLVGEPVLLKRREV